MKIAIMSDPHFHPFKAFSTLVEGRRNSRLNHIRDTWHKICQMALKEKCEMLLVCGDIFNVRGSIKPSVLNVVVECLEHAAHYLPVVLIPGNHDMEDFKGGATAVDVLEAINNVYVMGQPSFLTVRGLRIAGIPYQNTLAEFEKAVGSIYNFGDADVVMMHQGIDDLAPKGVPAGGFTVKKVRELCGDTRLILCGHYHKPGREKNVIQVGAPLQHNFNDEGQERGFWTCHSGHHVAKFHPLDLAPKFYTLHEDMDDTLVTEGDFLRVKASSAEKAAAAIKGLGGYDHPIEVVIEREFKRSHKKTVKVSSVADMLEQYFKIKRMPAKERKAAMSLYAEVCA